MAGLLAYAGEGGWPLRTPAHKVYFCLSVTVGQQRLQGIDLDNSYLIPIWYYIPTNYGHRRYQGLPPDHPQWHPPINPRIRSAQHPPTRVQ